MSAGNGSEYDPISVAVAGGIYNPKTAPCNPTCETCNGCTSFPSGLTPNPFTGSVGNSGWMYSQCPWYNGTQYTYNNSGGWSSNNTGIATVQTKGQANPGLTYGAGSGSVTISSLAQSIPTNAGQICGSPGPPACPVVAPTQSGPANIIKVIINSVSLTSNQISTTLAPSGMTGAFSLWESTGSSSNYSQTAVNRGAGTYPDGFNLTTSTATGQYSTIYAAWSVASVQVITSYNFRFYNYGNAHHSQYTLINESTCSGGNSTAYIITNQAACFSNNLLTTTLNSQFESQTALNGTGQSNSYGLLKALAASSCKSATQGKPAGANNNNSFVQVSSVTGACNVALSTSTVAQYSHSCGLQIFLTGYGNPGTVKTVEDECPRCATDPPHVDNWNPNGGPSCSLTMPDLGSTGYFVTEQVQQ